MVIFQFAMLVYQRVHRKTQLPYQLQLPGHRQVGGCRRERPGVGWFLLLNLMDSYGFLWSIISWWNIRNNVDFPCVVWDGSLVLVINMTRGKLTSQPCWNFTRSTSLKVREKAKRWKEKAKRWKEKAKAGSENRVLGPLGCFVAGSRAASLIPGWLYGSRSPWVCTRLRYPFVGYPHDWMETWSYGSQNTIHGICPGKSWDNGCFSILPMDSPRV